MIVYKFGGASVSSASSIENLAAITSAVGDDLMIVISAFGKTTNTFERTLEQWYGRAPERFETLKVIMDYHRGIMRELLPGHDPVWKEFKEMTRQLEERLSSVPSDDYDFEYDQLVSFGEIASTRIVSAYLNSRGIGNTWLDARKWLITDDTFREAKVDYDRSAAAVRKAVPPGNRGIWITQGFIGGTAGGHTTTLGREGSDYTAAVAASLLDAVAVVVWKDVPGIMTADPLIFSGAEKLDEISYLEAIELSFYGARIIHPKTIKPLQNKNIPLYVRPFSDPGATGTIIHGNNPQVDLKPILIIKEKQLLLSLVPRDFSFVVEECLSRIFSLLFKYRMKANLIQHSAISFTICMDDRGKQMHNMLEEIRSDFRVLYNGGLELVTIRHYTQEAIERHTAGKEVLVEQRSRSTVMFVVR